jgi:hypothetical protein
MRLHSLSLTMGVALLSGCATVVHGPLQDVRIDSNPPGATVTVSPMLSERGPNFLDEKKQYTVTTPATLRLRRDNTYRVEVAKQGYKITTTKVVPSYDWLWAPVTCGPCEAVGELPTYDLKGRALPVRFAEAAFYEYPKGFIRAIGRGLRVFSPDALLGNSFKLKSADQGYFGNWHAFGPTDVTANLEPISQ